MSAAVEATPSRSTVLAQALDFLSLTKPRLSGLVLFTAYGGIWLSGHDLSLFAWVATMLGLAGTVGAANAFNCVLERESDRFMLRTAKRPLPSGRIEPADALAFAAGLAAMSLPLLFAVNRLTGALGVLALVSYVLVYTPLKSRTHWAMWVGALPGALPPLMGVTAATGRVTPLGLALFAILFFWQLPHFIAIALFRKDEYRQAGLTSLPLERGDDVARWHALGYLAPLTAATLAPWVIGAAGPLYAVAAGVLNVMFTVLAVRGVAQRLGKVWARSLFLMSLVHLTGLFVALGVDHALG